MSLLYQHSELENVDAPLEAWKKEAYRLFASKMSDREARFLHSGDAGFRHGASPVWFCFWL